jgi:hypothetical protein
MTSSSFAGTRLGEPEFALVLRSPHEKYNSRAVRWHPERCRLFSTRGPARYLRRLRANQLTFAAYFSGVNPNDHPHSSKGPAQPQRLGIEL